jgi:surface carbohydrate biosynthesis protein
MRCLILPCETRAREFDAKLMLAACAAARGVGSIVGSKKLIDRNLTDFDPGVYVGKSLTDRSRISLAMAPLCGHRLAAWDEEGLVWASPEVYWRTKVDGASLKSPELLIAWGEDNAQAWRAHPDYAGTPIAVAGNPRSDLLQPRLRGYFAEQTEAISAAQGSFILINTNFSRVNHIQPSQNRHLKWLREKRPDDPRGGFARHKYQLFQSFREMLPRLANSMPETRFVLRPHPSEDQASWERLAADLANVVVERNGNIVPWLLAAKAVIHNGCTTAIEAYLLGRPALAFAPLPSGHYDHVLPNDLSLACASVEALAEAARGCLADPAASHTRIAADPRRQALITSSLAGVAEGRLASEQILDALAPLLANSAPPDGARPVQAGRLLGLRRSVHWLQSRMPGSANYQGYIRHMFPDTSVREVRQRIDRLTTCLGSGRTPLVEQVQPNVFQIHGLERP